MATVLIVEDEYLVRVGLRTCIDWESHGFTLLDDAVDGLAAYEQIHKYKPDIMLLDLKMPRMSGFELMQKLEDEGIFINTVILSCCDDFESVRTALRHRVVDYINKLTLNPDELLEVLNKIQILPSASALPETADKASSPDPAAALGRLINQNGPLNDTLGEDEKKLFSGGYLACLILTPLKPDHTVSTSIKLNMTRQILKNCGVESIICPGGKDSICIALPGTADRNTIANTLKVYLEPTLDVKCSIGFSSKYNDYSQIRDCFGFAGQIADELFWERPGSIAVYTRTLSMNDAHKAFYESCKKAVYCNICANNKAGVLNGLSSFLEYFSQAANIPRDEFIKYASSILELFQTNSEALDNQYYKCQKAIINAGQISIVKQKLLEFADIFFNSCADACKCYSPLVAEAIKYIIDNPSRFVQLTEVSERINVSKPYLSQLFKKETGVNFVTYVHRYKINLAKEMLNNNTRVGEICDKIGFENSNYFTKIFKRFTGLSPTEYRDLQKPQNSLPKIDPKKGL